MQPASNPLSQRNDSDRRMCAGWDEPTGSGPSFNISTISINWLLAKRKFFFYAKLPADSARPGAHREKELFPFSIIY